jgi:phosphate transport system substrate-binding protein
MIRIRFFWLIILASGVLVSCAPSGREVVRIVGSSTVYPFSRTVSERFAIKSGYSAPVIEVTGTGAGFKRFCSGPGAADISNASRKIEAGELSKCQENGVFPIVEFMFGYDGIVVAVSPENPLRNLTLDQLYLALAREIPGPKGEWVSNPYQHWSEIDPSLPDIPILVHGPPPTSGTRDAFVELGMEGGAKQLPALGELKTRDPSLFKARAGGIREDGVWIDEGENDNAIIQIIRQSDYSIGIFGYSFYEQNTGIVKAVSLSGVEPDYASIARQDYPLARSLYFYSQEKSIRRRLDIQEYINEFVSEAAIGPYGYLAEKGLISLADPKRQALREQALDLTEMKISTLDQDNPL